MFPWGALIDAGASLAGGFLNRSANEDASQAATNARLHESEMQRQFAQAGLRWRASDAMEAYKSTGLHPLAMLGVSGPSYSPVNFVGSANNSMGDAIARAGQGIGRAIDATSSQRERLEHAGRLDALVLERAGLENELLRTRIASENAVTRQSSAPAMPVGARWMVDGQGNAPGALVKEKPMERSPGNPGALHTEPGSVTDLGFARTRTGYAPLKSKDTQDRQEEDNIGSFTWNLRNRILPTFGLNYSPPYKAPLGYEWRYVPVHQEYRLYKLRGTYAPIRE